MQMRIHAVHPGALIQVGDQTRALARRRQHRYRGNNRRPTRTCIRGTQYNLTITNISHSSLPPIPLRRPMDHSCLCGAPRTSHPARPRPSLRRRRHLRPSGRAHRLLHPCRLALRRPWLPPVLYLRMRLRISRHQRHRHVQRLKRPLRASPIRVRDCRRSVSSANHLLDFRVRGLVVHVMGSEIWVHFWRIGVMHEAMFPFFQYRYPGPTSCMIYSLFLLVGACTMKPRFAINTTTIMTSVKILFISVPIYDIISVWATRTLLSVPQPESNIPARTHTLASACTQCAHCARLTGPVPQRLAASPPTAEGGLG